MLKCENILDSELAMLPELQKCKKVIVWSVDFGMDQYVSWCLPADKPWLDVLWSRYEGFCKPQADEVRARFDILTSFRQGNRSVDEWYNAVQTQITLAKYPPETVNILHKDIFSFFLKDEDFFSRTFNECSVDLQRFPASKVRQLAKRMEASKANAPLIKQVASGPNQSDETSENRPPTKKVQKETKICQA